jgi:hypothetical protein
MRIVLVGAPGSGKEDLAWELRDAFQKKDQNLIGPVGDASEAGETVGPITDYRTELMIGVDRIFDMLHLGEGNDVVFTGTILDNVVHTLVHVAAATNAGAFSYGEELRWEWTTQLLYAMMLDSFKADHVFYLRGGEPEDLAGFYPELLDQVQVDYVELEGDRSAYLETVLQKLEADEPRPDNGDTEPKDA